MNKKLVVKQNGFKDCGPSCLLSIMKYYGVEASHEEVTFTLRTNQNGTNAYNIINGSKMYGFDGYGIHYTVDEIINNKVNFPIICHVKKNNYYHFIVVYNNNNKYLEIMDPSSNINKMTYEEFKSVYLNTSIVIYKVKNIKNIDNYNPLKSFIFDYIKIEYKSIIKILFYSYLIIILGIITNYYMLISIDYVLPNYNYYNYLYITSFFMSFYIIKNIFNYIRNKYLINTESNIFKKINNDILTKFFNLPYQFFKNKSTGEIIKRLSDIKVFKELLSEIIVTISLDALIILSSLIILININTKLFVINIIEIIIYLLLILLYRNRFNIKNENTLICESDYNRTLTDGIYSYENNKNLNLISLTIKKISIKFNKYIDTSNSYKKLLNKQSIFKSLIVDISNILVIFFGINLVSNKIISLGEFILYNSIIYYFTEPIKNILDLNTNIIHLKNIYRRINDLLIIKSERNNLSEMILKDDIIINNLSYSHDGYKNTIEDISLNIKYGSKYLIYGKSGNGKSTLIKILLKYLDDYNGEIYIGNINLKDISKNVISNNIVYVSQNSYLLHDTFKNNIIYDRNINDLEYERVINICNLNDLRNSKKMRNDFIIEDDGFNISGGERQKIILARALLNKFNYLILDEALSEVEFKEEKQILEKIINIYHDKTIIYISHKKEMIDMFNDKYKLERRNNDK